MEERLVPLSFYFAESGSAEGVWLQEIPVQCTIVAVEYTLHTSSSAPTGANIDIQDDGADAITAIALAAFAVGSKAEWLSKHLRGANAPVEVAAGSVLEIDLNLTGGSTPKQGLNGIIWVLLGAQKA